MVGLSHTKLLQRPVKRYAYLRACLLLRLSLVVITLLSAGANTVHAADAKQLFFEGFELLKAGKAKAAATKFERGLKLEPNNAEGHFYLGEAYRARKQMNKARQQYEASMKADENSKVAAQARERLAALTDAAGSGTAPATTSKNSDAQTSSTTFSEAANFVKQRLVTAESACSGSKQGVFATSSILMGLKIDEVNKILTVESMLLFSDFSDDTRLQIKSTIRIPFSELTLDVETKPWMNSELGGELTLFCSSEEECIQHHSSIKKHRTSYDGPILEQSEKDFRETKAGITYCPKDRENVQRVQRALEHMLKVSGAKKSPF